LCAAAANTESLLQYFEAQEATEKGEAKKLTRKCIEWKRDDLRRIRELIPQALGRRELAAHPAPVEEVARELAASLRNGDGQKVRDAVAILRQHGCGAQGQEPRCKCGHTRSEHFNITRWDGYDDRCKFDSCSCEDFSLASYVSSLESVTKEGK
jgi:hypothetical protein